MDRFPFPEAGAAVDAGGGVTEDVVASSTSMSILFLLPSSSNPSMVLSSSLSESISTGKARTGSSSEYMT